jgi:hypothetical protein
VSPAIGIACCDAVNRGAVYAEGLIVYNLLDGTLSPDATTGRENEHESADLDRGEITYAAVVKNRVLVGPSGGEFGIRGWFKALDLASGKIAWTARNLGPDSDARAPSTYHPFYDKGPDLGTRTWARHLATGGAPLAGSQ